MACARWLLPVPPGPRNSASSRLPMKRAGGQIEDQAAIHLRVEGEVEIIERSVRVAKAGLFTPSLQQTISAAGEFVGDQTRDQIDGGHGFGLSLV